MVLCQIGKAAPAKWEGYYIARAMYPSSEHDMSRTFLSLTTLLCIAGHTQPSPAADAWRYITHPRSIAAIRESVNEVNSRYATRPARGELMLLRKSDREEVAISVNDWIFDCPMTSGCNVTATFDKGKPEICGSQ